MPIRGCPVLRQSPSSCLNRMVRVISASLTTSDGGSVLLPVRRVYTGPSSSPHVARLSRIAGPLDCAYAWKTGPGHGHGQLGPGLLLEEPELVRVNLRELPGAASDSLSFRNKRFTTPGSGIDQVDWALQEKRETGRKFVCGTATAVMQQSRVPHGLYTQGHCEVTEIALHSGVTTCSPTECSIGYAHTRSNTPRLAGTSLLLWWMTGSALVFSSSNCGGQQRGSTKNEEQGHGTAGRTLMLSCTPSGGTIVSFRNGPGTHLPYQTSVHIGWQGACTLFQLPSELPVFGTNAPPPPSF